MPDVGDYVRAQARRERVEARANALAVIHAARSYVATVEEDTAEEDGGIALHLAYRLLRGAVANYEKAELDA